MVDSTNTTYYAYTYASVQMLFALALDDMNVTDFRAAVKSSVVAGGTVAKANLISFGIWAGSVIVQVNFADTASTGSALSALITSGLDVSYENITYRAMHAAGNSTSPTPSPTHVPTPPTQSPTRAPTIPARDAPFQESSEGIPLTQTKLLVAAVAAAVVSFSSFMVLITTELRLYMSGEYRTKINSMAMRYIDYDGANPSAPLLRENPAFDSTGRATATAERSYGTADMFSNTAATYPTLASDSPLRGPTNHRTSDGALVSSADDHMSTVDASRDYITFSDVNIVSPTGRSYQGHTVL